MLEGGRQAVHVDEDLAGMSRVRELAHRLRNFDRLLGRRTMEVEIPEALDLARAKKPAWQLPSWSTGEDASR